ncbi:hypothetical protein IMZ31_20975 (plasmid) [Pontibacillus sp. ALD_SL1]|uniref:hypothetical protein n=1 Tax=Pontibacillus sp. ALD_SL1 TaxID=2777185 RepID=UPI001A958D99|nr:hypothetical protein [Pontibacillus sp. ALD_SL1]QST03023.1 hypothetical protein IMZ31_20975 [Pontibacillus sp. ALD_SL1]
MNQFKEVVDRTESLYLAQKEKYGSLQRKDWKRWSALQKEEQLLMYDLEQAIKTMKTMLGNHSLSDYENTEDLGERELFMACQRRAIHFDRELKNITTQCERLMEGYATTERIKLEAFQKVAQQQEGQVSLFNHKY